MYFSRSFIYIGSLCPCIITDVISLVADLRIVGQFYRSFAVSAAHATSPAEVMR